jgi:hypothetical protein
MPERKTELISLRVTPTFKRGLKLAAEAEKRSQANFLEKLVLDYCEQHGIPTSERRSRASTPAETVKSSRKARK